MNAKRIVSLSNIIGILSIFLLIYWVFIFVSTQVFGFKVFRENMTQTFYLSILGILSLMFGALIINVMFNLTRIAEKHNNDSAVSKQKKNKLLIICFIASFPIIFSLLFSGDLLTSIKKEKMLIRSALSIINSNIDNANHMADYKFDETWINQTADILRFMSKMDKNYKTVSVIIKDQIDGTPVFLQFNRYYYDSEGESIPNKIDFIFETSVEERKYLQKVFDGKYNKELFSAYDGKYKLFYPYILDKKIIVLYFSDSQEYGKIGS